MTKMTEYSWGAFERGASIGTVGSESGTIVQDEEYRGGARVTLERATSIAPLAITCGIYGLFFHTCFFSAQDTARSAYDDMKTGLAEIVDMATREPESDPVLKAVRAFVDRFST